METGSSSDLTLISEDRFTVSLEYLKFYSDLNNIVYMCDA